jgi:hypothetical protein
MQQATTAEMRLDAGMNSVCSAPAQSTGVSTLPADAVYDLPLPNTLEGVILVRHFPESGGFRLRHQCPTGQIIVIPMISEGEVSCPAKSSISR